MKRQTLIAIVVCIFFLGSSAVLYLRTSESNSASTQQWDSSPYTESPIVSDGTGTAKGNAAAETECAVYICGAVKNPGVYRFSGDSRVCDALESAGGFTKKADKSAVNQARPLVDGEQIIIPRKRKKKQYTGSDTKNTDDSSTDSGLVNINQADQTQLMTLAGIGAAKARLIIDYRTENGSFASIEDIMKISGIKEGIYNRIKDQITV